MKTKTIKAEEPKLFDELIEEFNNKYNAKFTQTHIVSDAYGVVRSYVAVLFYEEK